MTPPIPFKAIKEARERLIRDGRTSEAIAESVLGIEEALKAGAGAQVQKSDEELLKGCAVLIHDLTAALERHQGREYRVRIEAAKALLLRLKRRGIEVRR